MRAIILGLMLGLTPVLAAAADKPTPDEARKVLEYIYHGKGQSPVLVDIKLCNDIQRDGDYKNSCDGDITGQPIKKGDAPYVWLRFMSPDGDETKEATVQFEFGGQVVTTKTVKIPGQQRSRTWYKHHYNKAGTWTIKASLASGEALGSLDVTVQ